MLRPQKMLSATMFWIALFAVPMWSSFANADGSGGSVQSYSVTIYSGQNGLNDIVLKGVRAQVFLFLQPPQGQSPLDWVYTLDFFEPGFSLSSNGNDHHVYFPVSSLPVVLQLLRDGKKLSFKLDATGVWALDIARVDYPQ